jgi:hypothetical protein
MTFDNHPMFGAPAHKINFTGGVLGVVSTGTVHLYPNNQGAGFLWHCVEEPAFKGVINSTAAMTSLITDQGGTIV